MGIDIGPRIGIEGEKQFKDSMRAINSQIKANDAELKKLSVEYDKNNNAVDNLSRRQKVLNDSLNANQQKVKALSAEYDRQKTKLSGLETALETARKENGENSKEAAAAETAYTRQAEAVNKLESQISYTSGQISKLSEEIRDNSTQLMEARSHAIKYGESMQEAGEKITAVGDKVSKAGTALTIGVTAPLAALGKMAVTTAMDAETSYAKVETIADKAVMNMEGIRVGVTKMSDETGIAVTDFNEALYQTISATGDTANAIEYTTIAAKAAKGGFTDTAIAVDGLTTIMNAYGQTGADAMEKIADQMLTAQNYGKTTFGELADSMGQIVPIASQLEIGTDTLLSALATLTKNGIRTSEAVTGLKAGLSNIIKPTEDAKNAAEALGIDFSAAALQSKGLAGFMGDVKAAVEEALPEYAKLSDSLTKIYADMDAVEAAGQKNTDQYKSLKEAAESTEKQMETLTEVSGSQIEGFATLFGSVRGLNSMLVLASETGEKDFVGAMEAMENSAGATQTAFEQMDSTSAAQMKKELNKLKNTGIDMGNRLLPIVTDIVKAGGNLVAKFDDLDDRQKNVILRTTGIAAAAGPVLKIVGTSVSGVGKLTSGIGGLVKDLGKISAAKKSAQALELVGVEAKGSTESVSGLSTTLAKLASPAGVAVVAAGALIGVGAAVLKIRDDAIKADIEKHFGNIRLSAEEVEDVAKRLTASEWQMKVSTALDAKKDLEQMEANMKSAMETINKTEWKVSVGLSLTEEEKSSYLSSVESFTKSASDYITQQGYTISLALDATIGNDSKTGAGLSAFVNSYMASAQGELEELGKQLADKVNKSFENGTFAEDQVDIQKIYDQMNAILQEISDAEYEAKMDGMKIKYSAEGFGIDKDSFDRLNEEMGKDFEETVENLMEAQETALTGAKMQYKAMIKEGISEEFAGSVYQDTYNAIKADTLEKVGDAAGVGFKYAFDTITNNYKEEVEKSKQGVSQYTDDYLNSIKGQIEDGTFLWEKAITQFEQEVPALEGSAKRTVQDMVESLKPRKEALQGLANECIAAGQSVPESVQQGLNDIAKWEAMAGSASGMYTLLAQELAENPGKFAALRETTEFGKNIPQELADAITIHTGYVYNAATGIWEQVKSGSEISAEEAADMLNKCGETLGEELCKSLQNQYGLIYQNGQYMVDQAAKGAEGNKSTFIKVSTSVAAAGVGGMRTVIKNTTLDPPNMSQPDWTPQARNALADMQEVVSGITFTGNLVLNATAGIIHPHADGGIVTRPEIGLVGEDGPEAIIPLSKSRRSEAMSLLSAVEGVVRYDPFAYSASAAKSMSASHRQSERTPAPAETKPTYQIGDIKVEIHTETDDPDKLYREFTTRLNRDVGRAIRSSRG